MKVVIIDDGVNPEYFNIGTLEHDLEATPDGELIQRLDKTNERSHGTVCAAIIKKYAPQAEICSIKVMDCHTGNGRREQLIAALNWCLARKVNIINLSLGSTVYKDFSDIRRAIAGLFRRGCIIIAAYHNGNKYTLPACLETTIGVRSDKSIVKYNGYHIKDNFYETYIRAVGRHKIIDYQGNVYDTPPANSYAAPYVTASVCNMMSEHPDESAWKTRRRILGLERSRTSFWNFPDALDEAVIINCGQEEWYESFYFDAVRVLREDGKEEIGTICENTFFVILADCEDEFTGWLDELQQIERYVEGIFLCFHVKDNEYLNKYDFAYKVWNESEYIEKFTGRVGLVPEMDIPVIYVYGKKKELVLLLKEIEDIFAQNGYWIKIVGQFPRAYLYGYEYINRTENRVSVIQNMYRRYQCDIILCGICGECIEHDIEDLYFVFDEKNDNCIEYADKVYRTVITDFQ